jgi:hypothetical protein
VKKSTFLYKNSHLKRTIDKLASKISLKHSFLFKFIEEITLEFDRSMFLHHMLIQTLYVNNKEIFTSLSTLLNEDEKRILVFSTNPMLIDIDMRKEFIAHVETIDMNKVSSNELDKLFNDFKSGLLFCSDKTILTENEALYFIVNKLNSLNHVKNIYLAVLGLFFGIPISQIYSEEEIKEIETQFTVFNENINKKILLREENKRLYNYYRQNKNNGFGEQTNEVDYMLPREASGISSPHSGGGSLETSDFIPISSIESMPEPGKVNKP